MVSLSKSQLLPLYSQVTSQSRDVVAMMLFDKNMNKVAHLGRDVTLPPGQELSQERKRILTPDTISAMTMITTMHTTIRY